MPQFLRRFIVISMAFAGGASAACSSTTSAPAGGNTAADAGGGTGPGTTATAAKPPCQLMVLADAEAAVGQPLPKNDEDRTLGTCGYNAADFTAGASLTVGTWDSLQAAANAGPGVPVAISGVGDEALNLNGANGSLLYVRKGSEGFLVVLNGPNIDHLADHGLALEKVLASQILANF